jgi:Fic family protein
MNIEWSYNSNGIEGNTLNLNETRMVLQDGMTVKGKSLREHLEITNHHDAIEFVEQIAQHKSGITEKNILNIHEIVMLKIEKEFAGRYRNGAVRIMGANFNPPNPLKISIFMEELTHFINTNSLQLTDIEMAAVLHHRFVWIHPFFDGNGRTVRLLMNLFLMRNGYPPAIILKNDRKKYYDALNHANNGNYYKLILLITQAIERSLDIYLMGHPGTNYQYLPLSSIIEEERLPYGQEYLSLLARQGKIDAFKEGRNWYTSKKAVNDYLTNRKRKRVVKNCP